VWVEWTGEQLADYGLDGSVLLLRNCLQQFDLLEGSGELQQHKWPLKLDLLSLVVKKLLRQPNAGSVFCEAVQHILSSVVTKAFLENLSTELKLSLPEQIQLGLALTDAEELSHCQAGERKSTHFTEIHEYIFYLFLESMISEVFVFFLPILN
jgi:CCR4-NOT transcription complex subunit 1